jgi:hypothetical protein
LPQIDQCCGIEPAARAEKYQHLAAPAASMPGC